MDLGFVGWIQYIDYFGNIIINIFRSYIIEKNWFFVVNNNVDFLFGKIIFSGYIYVDCKLGELIVIIGFYGFVEIVVNGGSVGE